MFATMWQQFVCGCFDAVVSWRNYSTTAKCGMVKSIAYLSIASTEELWLLNKKKQGASSEDILLKCYRCKNIIDSNSCQIQELINNIIDCLRTCYRSQLSIVYVLHRYNYHYPFVYNKFNESSC